MTIATETRKTVADAKTPVTHPLWCSHGGNPRRGIDHEHGSAGLRVLGRIPLTLELVLLPHQSEASVVLTEDTTEHFLYLELGQAVALASALETLVRAARSQMAEVPAAEDRSRSA